MELFAVWCVAVSAGCDSTVDKPSDTTAREIQSSNQVTIVSYPLYEALRATSGDRLQLYFPEVAPGQPMDRETVKRVQASRMIVLDGTHHVGWVDTVALPESRKRVSTFDIMDQLVMVDQLGSHSHGPEGEHSHKGIVAQTWLDPALFQRQLRTVLTSCAQSGLLAESEVEPLVMRWWESVRHLDDSMNQLKALPVRRAIADRAGSEYLLRRLGWQVEIQELDKAMNRDPGQLEIELRQRFEEDPQLVLVLTLPPSVELDLVLKRLGIPVISLDLIEHSAGGSYLDRMAQNLKNLKNVLGQGP
ncbi:MAG: hypothetical protein Q8M16_16425 [Pirellulaceae bacterium]|nr:hypothetical protein [Pirellulaceae bacterium]